jgi:hypothetical protein
MEGHVTQETAKKLKDLATTSGRAPEDILEDALAGYLAEVASVRNTEIERRQRQMAHAGVRAEPVEREWDRRCSANPAPLLDAVVPRAKVRRSGPRDTQREGPTAGSRVRAAEAR